MWVACVTGYHSAGSAPLRPLCGGDGMDRLQTTVFVGCRPSPLHLNRMAFFSFRHWDFCYANEPGTISNSILPGPGQLSRFCWRPPGTFLVF